MGEKKKKVYSLTSEISKKNLQIDILKTEKKFSKKRIEMLKQNELKKDKELCFLGDRYKKKHFEYIDEIFIKNWKPIITSALQYAMNVEAQLLHKQDELDYERDTFSTKRSEYYIRFQEQECFLNLVRNSELIVRKRADTYEECLESYLSRIHYLESTETILSIQNKVKSSKAKKNQKECIKLHIFKKI